jgi:hypothetical protein
MPPRCGHETGALRNHGTATAMVKLPMIRANCRDRFTAEDFDFIVRTLGKSKANTVSLTALLSDQETRDSILDHELLFQAIISATEHLSISPQLYFYVLTRHVLKEADLNDLPLCDYISSLLENYSQTARMKNPVDGSTHPVQYLSDLMLGLRDASPVQTFLIRSHVGNYSLFLSGIFPGTVQARYERGAPALGFYEDMGAASFDAVAGHAYARAAGLKDVYGLLARQFKNVRLALNRLSDSLLNIDDASNIPLLG